MAKWVEYFIAERTAKVARKGLSSSRSSGGEESAEGGMMATIATVAISLSLIVMILTIAVVIGFKKEVHSRLTMLSGDIIISTNRGVNPSIVEPISLSNEIERVARNAAAQYNAEIRHITPYAARSVVVRSPSGVEGVVVKGVDSTFDLSLFERGLIEGEIPQFGGDNRSRNAIISRELSSELELSIGDKLELLASNSDGSIRRDLYRVGAIYAAGSGAAEKLIIMVDMRDIQRLNRWSADEISGYEIGVTDRKRAIDIASQINEDLLHSESDDIDNAAAFATEQLFPGIFDWLKTLDINAVVIISIMMTVAIFNIITAILILVLERMQMVGILKSLGMESSSISRIFLHRASSITLRGLLWGNGVGITIALLQRHFEIIKLDETGYILSSVPIELGVGWIVMLNIGVLATTLLAVMLPTRIVSKIEPHRAIKFQ